MPIHSMEAQHEAIGEVASKGNLRKASKQAKQTHGFLKDR